MSVPSELLDSQDSDHMLDRSDNYFFGNVRKNNKNLVVLNHHQTNETSTSRRFSYEKSVAGTAIRSISKNESFISQ